MGQVFMDEIHNHLQMQEETKRNKRTFLHSHKNFEPLVQGLTTRLKGKK